MEHIFTRILEKLINLSGENTESSDIEVYTYGLLSYVYTIIPIIALIIISIIFSKPLEMLLWIIIFLALRKYSGGFHAKTPLLCFIYSVLLGSSCLIISFYAQSIPTSFYYISVIFNYIFLFIVAPVTQKEFTTTIRIRCKLKITMLIFILGFFIHIFFPNLQIYFLHALFSTSFLCIAYKLQK